MEGAERLERRKVGEEKGWKVRASTVLYILSPPLSLCVCVCVYWKVGKERERISTFTL